MLCPQQSRSGAAVFHVQSSSRLHRTAYLVSCNFLGHFKHVSYVSNCWECRWDYRSPTTPISPDPEKKIKQLWCLQLFGTWSHARRLDISRLIRLCVCAPSLHLQLHTSVAHPATAIDCSRLKFAEGDA